MTKPASERIARHFEGRWLRGYARGKLRSDPVFAVGIERLKDSPLPLLDVGCGIGLLEFSLREAGAAAPLMGCDFDETKIVQARRIAAAVYPGIRFEVADVTQPLPAGEPGNVAIFDVLHYLPAAAQRDLLTRLIERVAPGGLCIIRATPRDGGWRFRATQAEEWFIRAITWMKSGAVHYLRAEEITAPFAAAGFSVEVRPLWGRTPFNSHLFVFRRPR